MRTTFTVRWTDGSGTERQAAVLEDDGVFVRDWDGVLHGPYADEAGAAAAHRSSFTFGNTDTAELDVALWDAGEWIEATPGARLFFRGERAYVADDGTLVSEDDRYAWSEEVACIEWRTAGGEWGYRLERLGFDYFASGYDGDCEPFGTFDSEADAVADFHERYTPGGFDDDDFEPIAGFGLDDGTHQSAEIGVDEEDAHRWRPSEPDESDLAVRIGTSIDG